VHIKGRPLPVGDMLHVTTACAASSVSSIEVVVEILTTGGSWILKVPRSLARDLANELLGAIKREVTAKWVPDYRSAEN
jgi:hypothetical protein